jgi:hypothetical protein
MSAVIREYYRAEPSNCIVRTCTQGQQLYEGTGLVQAADRDFEHRRPDYIWQPNMFTIYLYTLLVI